MQLTPAVERQLVLVMQLLSTAPTGTTEASCMQTSLLFGIKALYLYQRYKLDVCNQGFDTNPLVTNLE